MKTSAAENKYTYICKQVYNTDLLATNHIIMIYIDDYISTLRFNIAIYLPCGEHVCSEVGGSPKIRAPANGPARVLAGGLRW